MKVGTFCFLLVATVTVRNLGACCNFVVLFSVINFLLIFRKIMFSEEVGNGDNEKLIRFWCCSGSAFESLIFWWMFHHCVIAPMSTFLFVIPQIQCTEMFNLGGGLLFFSKHFSIYSALHLREFHMEGLWVFDLQTGKLKLQHKRSLCSPTLSCSLSLTKLRCFVWL